LPWGIWSLLLNRFRPPIWEEFSGWCL